jgi:serine/threonine-protein kinase
MSDPHLLRDDVPKRSFTQPCSDGEQGAVSRRVRCRVAAGSGLRFTDEMAQLLRTRLHLAILILLGGFALHFLKHLLPLGSGFDHRPLWLLFTGCEIAVMAIALALLGSRRPLSLRTLRILEWTIFGMIAALFAWLQVDTYYDGALVRALAPGHEAIVYRLVGISAALRWFLLIVLYGTFIPSTARRCATVVGGLAVLPVALLLAASLLNPTTGAYMLTALPETIILMATAVAIAVFGSHKMRELYQKAHEAQRLGQYRLKRVLGFGGMGTVYLAEHVLLRRPCAIKLIRPDQAGDPTTLIRFEREVQATATLTHPNTIEVFDYGHADDGTFYYVMEYLPGTNLEDMVEQYGPLPPARAVHLLRQVCQALREAHGIGLMHRDIKPSNIIACERGKVYDVAKLLDFGLVKPFAIERVPQRGRQVMAWSVNHAATAIKLTQEGTLAGSPAFMSPEQARSQEPLDARSDIYSVGVVAYFLVTGKLPFDRDSAVEMLHAHAYEPVVPTPEFQASVPADLQQVILRCLKKEPDLRYPDAAALEKALAACHGISEWTPERAEEWWQRHAGPTALPDALDASKSEQETMLVSS